MAFMERETLLTDWFEVDTTMGTCWVPTDVAHEDALDDFVEGEIHEVTRRDQCWGARLSAPGYMDCTDWCGGFATEEEAEAYLVEMYGDDEEESEEEALCGLCGEPVEGRDKFSTDGQTYLCQSCHDTAFTAVMAKAITNLGRK
jgi:hypothetical protein